MKNDDVAEVGKFGMMLGWRRPEESEKEDAVVMSGVTVRTSLQHGVEEVSAKNDAVQEWWMRSEGMFGSGEEGSVKRCGEVSVSTSMEHGVEEASVKDDAVQEW